MNPMSGVTSPTNLSMYPTSRNSNTLTRWNTPYIALEEDFNLMTAHQVSASNPDANNVILMDEGNFIFLTFSNHCIPRPGSV